MTLHSSLFFESSQNYIPGRITQHNTSTVITEMSDNDYRTFSRVTDINIDMSDADGNPTEFDYIFAKLKGQGIGYAMTPIGGSGTGFSGRQIPTSVERYEKTPQSTVVSNFLHELYALPAPVSATSVRLQFTGTDVQVHALMLLKLGYEINANQRYREIDFNRVDRTGSLTPNPTGRTRRNPPFDGTRLKWVARYTALFRKEPPTDFMYWIENHPNCVFAQEFSRYPARVYPATFPDGRIRNGYINGKKSNGEYVQFRIAEQ